MVTPLLCALLLSARPEVQLLPNPPVAKKVRHTTKVGKEVLFDDYFWLREKDSKEVLDYLKAENAYADTAMQETEALQKSLYAEMLGRIKQTDLSVPYRYGDYLYFTRTEEGKQYPIYCRRKSESAPEEVLLDVNKLAEGQKFMDVGAFAVSDNGTLLAYTVDNAGFRQYKLFVKDLQTGALLPDTAERVTGVEWAADNQTILFGTEDETTKRSDRVFRLKLGEKPVQVYEEKDALYNCWPSRTMDRKFLLISSASAENNESWFCDSAKPTNKFKLIEKRQGELEYSVEHRDGTFYIRTNKNHKDFEIMTTLVRSPGKKNWKTLIPPIEKGHISGFDLFQNYLVVAKLEDGLSGLSIVDLKSLKSKDIPREQKVGEISSHTNVEFKTDRFVFSTSSPIQPPSVYELDMVTMDKKLLKKTEVLGGYDPTQYTVERIHATAPDGTTIPMALVFRKDKRKSGGNPVLLEGYGAYGARTYFGFGSNEISLMDRGFVLASAQIRGGGDMGAVWHDQGKMRFKRNTFTDFIACADELVYSGWTTRDKLAISGGSAGGLLIGATLNIRPDLCKAALLYVPFVDVINTMLDESLPLTVGEFLEWGNPKVPEDYAYIRTYSPYENIRATKYPDLLVRTSYSDSQVMYWEPAKYVARMRAVANTDLLLFKINMAGGHGGSSGRYDLLAERAFDYAWLIERLEAKLRD